MTIKWEDLSEDTLEVMRELGNFGPTTQVKDKEVKGYSYDVDTGERGKTYWNPTELRKIASACQEVAVFLENRAIESSSDT